MLGLCRFLILVALFALPTGLVSCERSKDSETSAAETDISPPEPVLCRVEVRSFIVMGRGRHLYLLIDCPEGYDKFDGRVEYTSAAYRSDYSAPTDRSGAARVAKMSAGRPLFPIIENAQDRLEGEFEVTLEQAVCLQRDRVFSARYALLGTNSSSGLRRTMEQCGCSLPDRVIGGGGMLGDFPGIDQDPGPVIERELWPSFGIEGEVDPMLPGDTAPGAEDFG